MGSSVELARARRRKKEAAQRRKEQELWNKAKKPLLIAAAVIVVIVIACLVISNSVKEPYRLSVNADGIVGVQDSWVVMNLGTAKKPVYYHLASVEKPEGYTLDPDYDTEWYADGTRASYNQPRFFFADDENALIPIIYVRGFANVQAKDAPGTVKDKLGSYYDCSDVSSIEIGGSTYYYFTYTSDVLDETGSTVEGRSKTTLCAYTDTVHDAVIGICLIHREHDAGDATAVETLLQQLQGFAPMVTVSK